MKHTQFAADTRIDIRMTGYRKNKIKSRAKSLGKTMTEYILDLIDKDMELPKTE